MNITLERVNEDDKSILRQLLELYLHDFSEYDSADINEHGYYGYRYFDLYWIEPGRHPFFIRVNNRLAGFVLVGDHCYILTDPERRSIAEFFVMRKYRRKGVGYQAAWQVFDQIPGVWEVNQHKDALAAQRFWENTIRDYTKGQYEIKSVVTKDWNGQSLIFDNRK